MSETVRDHVRAKLPAIVYDELVGAQHRGNCEPALTEFLDATILTLDTGEVLVVTDDVLHDLAVSCANGAAVSSMRIARGHGAPPSSQSSPG